VTRWDMRVVAASVCAALACSGAQGTSRKDASRPEGQRIARHEEEVVIPSAGIELAGTLVVPERSESAVLPALILVHGSGPNGRDAAINGQLGMMFGFEVAVFRDLAAGLADAGYVVLRYDKRTCTRARGCANNYPEPSDAIVIDEFVADVEAGITWLARRAEVDAKRVYLVGHSQGASFAPKLLGRRPELAAAIMLAGPYHPIDQGLAYQAGFVRELLRKSGVPDAQIDAQLASLDQAVADLARLREGRFSGAAIMGVPVGFWRSWLALTDEVPTLVPGLTKPLLALSGDYDWNVPRTETETWERAFAALDRNPGHKAVVLPCISHALNCISEPDWTKITPDAIGRHVHPSVLDAVRGFLDDSAR
jgi:uncharacterized protein